MIAQTRLESRYRNLLRCHNSFQLLVLGLGLALAPLKRRDSCFIRGCLLLQVLYQLHKRFTSHVSHGEATKLTSNSFLLGFRKEARDD
jgi:hypothetical protein